MHKITLYPFQLRGVRSLHHYHGVMLLADEMGLGKTIQVLQWLKESKETRPVVIITPSHLKWHWESEARTKFGLRTTVLSGVKPYKLTMWSKQIVILNYDILAKRIRKKKVVGEGWLNELKRIKPKCLILDEAHFCKSASSKRTKAVRQLAKMIDCVVAVTGTPILNRPAELYTSINMLWPEEFPSWFVYAHRYCRPVRMPWGWEYKGATHLDELREKLRRLGMVRRLKKDVLPQLPAKQRNVLPVEIPMKDYRHAEIDIISWLRERDVVRAKKAEKAEELVRLGYLKQLAAIEKLPAVIEFIENHLEQDNGKLVVYGIHRGVVRFLHEKFPEISVCLDGKTSKSDRKTIVNRFQTDAKVRLFFGSIHAGGTGITLSAASRLLFAELDWVPGNHTQAEDRIHRIGQEKRVEINYIVAKDTIEEDLCRVIQEKQSVVSQVLDNNYKDNNDTLNVFDLLRHEMLVKSVELKGTKPKQAVTTPVAT